MWCFKEYEVSDDERIILCNEWEDFQREFDVNLGFERQLSLRTALEMAGISFVGREHDALDDARNTAELFQVFRNNDLMDETLRKIRQWTLPSELENTLGSMFDFSSLVAM